MLNFGLIFNTPVNGSFLGGGDPYSNIPFVSTYALNLATSPLGYDIKEIRMFTDQGGDRAGQSYDIYYSLINAPGTFILLGTVSTPHTDAGAVMTRTYDSRAGATPDAGPAILSGVAQIQFHVRPVGDYGVVWREFDVTGTPSPNGMAVATATLTRSSGTGTDTAAGASLSFEVSVSGVSGTPTGTVTLKDGGSSGTVLGSASLTGGACTITTTALGEGTHDNIVAVYNGSLIYAISTSSALTPAQTVTIIRPPNDNFADAIALPGNNGSRSGTGNLFATTEVGEPSFLYGDSNTWNSVWFKWTCTQTGTYTINTYGTMNVGGQIWDSVIYIYDDATSSQLAAMDDGQAETASVSVTAGTTYHIRLAWGGGWVGTPESGRDTSDIHLTWSFVGSGGGNTYADWAGSNGGTADQDSNHDGVPNGIAYFMDDHGLITLPGLDSNNTITWKMSATFSGTYEVQTSPDLKTWTPVATQPTPAGGNLSYTLPKGAEGGTLFVRLAVIPD